MNLVTHPPRKLLSAALLAALLASTSCTFGPSVMDDGSEGVAVTPYDQGRLIGGQARYTVDAPMRVLSAMLLDFKDQAAYRPLVVKATALSRKASSGIVKYVFRTAAGFQPTATCRYHVTPDDHKSWVLTYDMMQGSMELIDLKGKFVLKSVNGGAKTRVEQDFLVSALMVDRGRLLSELAEDARAIRDHAEELAHAKPAERR